MHEGSAKGDKGKDLHRENNLLDVTRGATHRGRGAGNGFSENIESDQAAVEHEPERGASFLLWPACLEYLPEDIGENGQHDEWVEKYPRDAEHGAPIAEQHVALDQLAEQVAVGDESHSCFTAVSSLLLLAILSTG